METQVASNVEQVAPMFGIRDMDASLRFYVNGLGFEMTRKWIDEGKLRWCWLQLGGAALMLQEYRPEHLPEPKLGEGVSLNFICKDALAVYRELRSRGVDAEKPFVGNSMWVTGLTDPDGYKLYFESPTDMPEGTELSEDESMDPGRKWGEPKALGPV